MYTESWVQTFTEKKLSQKLILSAAKAMVAQVQTFASELKDFLKTVPRVFSLQSIPLYRRTFPAQ